VSVDRRFDDVFKQYITAFWQAVNRPLLQVLQASGVRHHGDVPEQPRPDGRAGDVHVCRNTRDRFTGFSPGGIYIRTDRGIEKPEDLKGRTIGLPEYRQTATAWIRGILHDEYGVRPTDVKWRTGGIEEPGRGERSPNRFPSKLCSRHRRRSFSRFDCARVGARCIFA
jgi:hypothetical protein